MTVQCTVHYIVQYSTQCSVQYSICMLGCQGTHWVESSKKMLTQISLVLACLGNVKYTVVYCTVYSTVQHTK